MLFRAETMRKKCACVSFQPRQSSKPEDQEEVGSPLQQAAKPRRKQPKQRKRGRAHTSEAFPSTPTHHRGTAGEMIPSGRGHVMPCWGHSFTPTHHSWRDNSKWKRSCQAFLGALPSLTHHSWWDDSKQKRSCRVMPCWGPSVTPTHHSWWDDSKQKRSCHVMPCWGPSVTPTHHSWWDDST